MANIFNEYGNIPHESPLNGLEQTIWDTVKDYIDKATELGASVIELRALEGHLMNIVSFNFAEKRLRIQVEMNKKKISRRYVYKFTCPRCNRIWQFSSAKKSTGLAATCSCGEIVYSKLTKEESKQQEFINFYHCPECDHEWEDKWMATCDDACPRCGMRNVSPYNSIDAE